VCESPGSGFTIVSDPEVVKAMIEQYGDNDTPTLNIKIGNIRYDDVPITWASKCGSKIIVSIIDVRGDALIVPLLLKKGAQHVCFVKTKHAAKDNFNLQEQVEAYVIRNADERFKREVFDFTRLIREPASAVA
jgi:hypothetical protein